MAGEASLLRQVRESLEFQLLQEYWRLLPRVRAECAASPSGGIAINYRREDWPAVLAVLRTLPDDVGTEAVMQALAAFPFVTPDADPDPAA